MADKKSSRRRRKTDAPAAGDAAPKMAGRAEAAWPWLARWGWLPGVMAAVLLYLPTLAYEFAYDDIELIAQNPRIVALTDWQAYLGTSWWDRPGSDREYRPATMASFAAQHALHGTKAMGYHLVNVLAHALVAGLVWLLGARVLRAPLAGTVAALLFAVHPVHIEAVAGIVGRAELLSTAAFLGALWASARAMGAEGGKRIGWSALVGALALLGAGFKEHAVLLPVAMLLLPRKEGERETWWRTLAWPLGWAIGGIALYFIGRWVVLGSPISPAGAVITPLDNPLIELGAVERRVGALAVAARYALLLVAPLRQSPDYSYAQLDPGNGWSDPLWLVGALLLAGAGGAAVAWRRRPLARFGLLLTLVTFAISSNLLVTIGTIMGERLLYLPSVGFCLMAGGLVARGMGGSTAARRWRADGAGVWLLAMLALHAVYLPHWRDHAALTRMMAERAPRSAKAQLALGMQLRREGDLPGARERLERSLAIYPTNTAAGELGAVHAQAGETDRAIELLARAHLNNPGDVTTAWEYARLLGERGELARARRVLASCVRASRGSGQARSMAAQWEQQYGKPGP